MSEAKASAKHRFLEEIKKYALVVIYLYVCFSVILLYKASILKGQDVEFLPYGIAIVKALVIGKFILIGDAIKIGARGNAPTLLHRIAWRTFLFLLMLYVFNFLEEVVVGWVHDVSFGDVLAEIYGRPLIEQFAPLLVMLLTLIPLITVKELSRSIGADELKRMFTGQDPA